jgi:hypothetical protein
MKKFLLLGLNTLALLVLAQMIIGQVTMPPAITITPSNGTAWDEITLTLDPTQACVPEGKGSVIGAAVIKMHSAAYLYDYIDDWGTTWGQFGVDYDKVPNDGIHTAPDLSPNGDGTYSITFVPGDFYGVEEGSTIIGITAVFNGGSWDNECKDFGDDGCKDFYIPLNYVNPTPAFKFKLDLTYQETLGNFNKDGGKAYVIVDGTTYEMEQLLEGIFPVAKYEYVMTEGVVKDQTYTYKFKMNDTEESIDARTVVAIGSQKVLSHFFNDEEPVEPTVTVKFQVDMRYYMREMKFDSATQYVDVAGSMNGWDGTNHHLADDNGDSIYTIDVEINTTDVGTTLQYKYRIDGSWDDDKSEFPAGGPNRRFTVRQDGGQTKDVFNNYRPGWVPVIFAVNMARSENIGQFDHTTDFMDVAGSFNDWGGSNQLFDDDADLIYVSSPPAIAPASTTIQYKFRINGSWDDATCEFPAGGPNREYTVLDTTGGVVNALDTVWYNNIGLFIESVTRLNEIMIYPNPATDVLYIENTFEIREIRVSNILGQTIMNFPVENKNHLELNTSGLTKGMYILSVYGEQGYKGTAKFIIK